MDDHEPGLSDATKDYEIGYKKPPIHTQFQKGQPRPARKPKPYEPTSRELMAKVLSEERMIRISGRKQKMRNYEIILLRLAEKAPSSSRLQALHYKLDAFVRRTNVEDDSEIFRVYIGP